MKYKVGDKVRISKDLAKCFSVNMDGEMNHWAGEVMTIKSSPQCDTYEMEEDLHENGGEGWWWGDEMISGLSENTKDKFINKPSFVVDKTCGFKSIYIDGITIAVPIETIVGIAYKNPADEYDEERGKSLAYYRMEGQE